MKKINILYGIILLALVIPVLSFANNNSGPGTKQKGPGFEARTTNIAPGIDLRLGRASSTENRLENRENIMDRIRARLASTTASTSERRINNLNNRLQKQADQMEKVKERLLNKEAKVTEILGKIANKIQARISILTTKGLDMTAANAKLAEANAKITGITTAIEQLTTLVETEITEVNQAKLFQDIRATQDKIRTLAKEAKALLIDTVKEINKVLPRNGRATTTATSTN